MYLKLNFFLNLDDISYVLLEKLYENKIYFLYLVDI